MAEIALLDCYTDEPSGLGVPPYLGTYPRYLAGRMVQETGKMPLYLTIDDLRSAEKGQQRGMKTDIKTYNITRPREEVRRILEKIDDLIIILGVHVPGKYLSAVPGTLSEVLPLISRLRCRKRLTGPVIFGSQVEGGKRPEAIPKGFETMGMPEDYREVDSLAVLGAGILRQIPRPRIIEIETGRGCPRSRGCSFCLEPIKHRAEYRGNDSIVKEVKALVKEGAKDFRLGKQSCFYSIPDPIGLMRSIRSISSVDILHIDNVNPAMVIDKRGVEITKAMVKYGSDGNVAAFGVESFDPKVISANNLNSNMDITMRAIRILNEHGARRGPRGMPIFLPGINILFGLIGETTQTHASNMSSLRSILDEGLLLRRINIRKVVVFPGTPIFKEGGMKQLRKNGRWYWKWREQIRQEIDIPSLKATVPIGTVLKEVVTEVHDGHTTFGRQVGTYPLIVGMKGRLPLGEKVECEVIGHMKRSIVAKVRDSIFDLEQQE